MTIQKLTPLLLSRQLKPLSSLSSSSSSLLLLNKNTTTPSSPSTTTPTLPTTTSIRQFSKGTRGSRGWGWWSNYRAGKGGHHLQGRWHERDPERLRAINDEIFALNSTATSNDIPEEVFLDVSIGGATPQRLIITLAHAALPITSRNFAALCTDTEGLGYRDTSIFRIEKNIGVRAGDVLHRAGNQGRCHPSVGVNWFPDEAFCISHAEPGIVTMTSPGVDRNDSRFLITTAEDVPHFDGRFVAFGRVNKEGLEVVQDMMKVFTRRGVPALEIKIVDCGEVMPEAAAEAAS